MESLALRNYLEDGQQGLAKRFFRATSGLVDVPWQITVGSDLQNSKVEGNRTMQARFINWYLAKFFQAAQYDGVLATKFHDRTPRRGARGPICGSLDLEVLR